MEGIGLSLDTLIEAFAERVAEKVRVRTDRRVFLDVRDLDRWIEENKT